MCSSRVSYVLNHVSKPTIMSIFKGFNFGPTLGPIGDGLPGQRQGRWVRSRRYDDAGATPLRGGLWVTELGWIDDPDPLRDPSPIGGGEGGGSGGGFRDPDPDPDPPLECPKWTMRLGTGATKVPRCSTEWQNLILSVFKELQRSVAWLNYLAQFGGGSLLQCVRSNSLCDFEFDCESRQLDYQQRTPLEIAENKLKRNYYKLGTDVYDSYPQAAHGLVLIQLIYAILRSCDVSELEAKIMADAAPVDGALLIVVDRSEVLRLLSEGMNNKVWHDDYVDDSSGRRRHVYYGQFLWYDPESGECGPYPLIDIVFPTSVGFKRQWKIF